MDKIKFTLPPLRHYEVLLNKYTNIEFKCLIFTNACAAIKISNLHDAEHKRADNHLFQVIVS